MSRSSGVFSFTLEHIHRNIQHTKTEIFAPVVKCF